MWLEQKEQLSQHEYIDNETANLEKKVDNLEDKVLEEMVLNDITEDPNVLIHLFIDKTHKISDYKKILFWNPKQLSNTESFKKDFLKPTS